MGGGDLNMKKSWHPLLLKNQERVWLEEKKALEEKKKLDQLRKEKEEERQLQELQRLQEEQTGKRRTEKLEWMYTTPATGINQNPNDLEDYLLGKKRVDKILTADENAQLGAAHKNFIAIQNANNVRDIAAKIREDPLLAIKQQEQAAYQALMSNPLRLREMQERNGIKPKKDKKEKKREKKEKKERLARERGDRSRSRSPVEDYKRNDRRHGSDDDRHYRRRSRSRSPGYRRGRDSLDGGVRTWPRSDESDDNGYGRRRSIERSGKRTEDDRKRRRSPSPPHRNSYPKRSRYSPPRSDSRPGPSVKRQPSNATEDRAAKLAAMQSGAASMEVERQQRLMALLEKEKADLEAEEQARSKSKGMGGFLGQEQKKVFGGVGGLEDRLRRGRGGLVAEAD
ncbi:Pre-mRNA splicing factor-domain-containing protein [Suillus clintonianus]|uniref:Pre-mRNA splicing factor-domain-containing protein n=1 Tax=Suillus clintonianus TaxID=1904413 RepID=UPI001B873D59|nr:Pre-mRNA splicing factor-domain-containing protein [Suillus clintonianus]KAG2155608.1 Pre-mRNA splicing factor-domain-containing protein [Suillus clintonianus]